LVVKWLPGGSSSEKPEDAKPVAVKTITPKAAETTPTSNEKEVAQHSWSQLISWMEQDGRMSPADLPGNGRNPFGVVAMARQPEEQEEKPKTFVEKKEEITPEQLGMVLSSTMVGPRGRSAIINGLTYDLKDDCLVNVGGQRARDDSGQDDAQPGNTGPKVQFKLEEIHPNHVVLVRQGKRYTLVLNRGKLGDRDRIVFKNSSNQNGIDNPNP